MAAYFKKGWLYTMANQITVSVNDTVEQLTQAYKSHKNLNECIYLDETWNLQVALINGALRFRAAYMYKNGKSDQNYIHITPQGQVQESNPQVKIRKDLVEKMESIVKGFNKASTEDLRKFITPALLRHYDELPDNIDAISLSDQQALGTQFINQDLGSGVLNLADAYADSQNLVLDRRVRDGFISILEEVLKQMRQSNVELPQKVKTQLMQDLVDARLDGQKVLMAVVKNLKYLVNESMNASGVVDSSQFKFYLNTVYGFVINNKSTQPIQFDKIHYKTGEKIGVGVLEPWSPTALSKAEVAMLLSRPTINCSISNATLGKGSRKTQTKLAWRNSVVLILKKKSDDAIVRYKDISQIPFEEWDRFLDGAKLISTVDRVLKYIYPDEETNGFSFRWLCDEIVKNCDLGSDRADEIMAEGLCRVLIKEKKLRNVEPNITRDKNNNIQVGVKRTKPQGGGLFGMFKR